MRYASVLVFVVLLVGCANDSPKKGSAIAATDPLRDLPQLAVETVHELRVLAKARDARTTAQLNAAQLESRRIQATAVLPGFETRASFSYVGTAHEATRALALAAGYEYTPPSTVPAKPLIVELNHENTSLMDVLRDLGARTGKVGRVEADTAPYKRLTFVYNTTAEQ